MHIRNVLAAALAAPDFFGPGEALDEMKMDGLYFKADLGMAPR